MRVEFTEYVLPNGRTRIFSVARPPEICEKAEQLKRLGLKLEIEILTTGAVSMTVENDEEAIAHEVVVNGPQVLEAVDKLINDAHARHGLSA